MNNRQKATLTIMVIIIIALSFWSWRLLIHGSYLNTSSICLNKINVENTNIQLSGDTSDSATGFSGYNYTIKGNSLYIGLRYCLVTKIHPSGSFNIIINDYRLQRINKVYFRGGNDDTKLIWQR